MPHDVSWQDASRVLAIRLDNLGDVLMTTPALAAIAGVRADGSTRREVTLLGSRAGVSAWPHLPWLHDAIAFDAPWVKGPVDAPRHAVADFALIKALEAGRFDAAVIFTVGTQSPLPAAMICRLAGVPLRLAHCRENPYDLLTHWQPDFETCGDGMRHEVARQLDLVGSVGFAGGPNLRFEVRPCDRTGLQAKLGGAGIGRRGPCVVLHPGASAASRRYPARRFGEAAAQILDAADCQVLVVGGPHERTLVDEVVAVASKSFGKDEKRLSAVPDDLTLGELGALIESAAVLLCNNSGPAHIAAAVGTPVTVLYALTNPQHTPWRVPARVLNSDVPCRNCCKSICPRSHHACLLGVPAQRVATAVLGLLHPTPAVTGAA